MKETITLKQLLENTPVEIEVPGVGTFKVREPTRKDRIDAMTEARQSSYWDKLSEAEQWTEIQERLVIKTIVEPKLTWEQYEQLPMSVQTAIVDVISAYHNRKILDLYKKRRKLIEDFLGLAKEENPSSSLPSYSG